MLLLMFLPVHSISSELWSAFCSVQNCPLLIISQLSLRVRRGHQSCLSKISSEWTSYSIVQIVRRYVSGISLINELKSHYIFSVFNYGVTLTSRTLTRYVATRLETNHVSLLLTFIQVLVLGAYGSRIFLDGVVASTMCYMLYRRSSGFTAQ